VGDLLVRVRVETPQKISGRMKELLQELRELEKEGRDPGLFDKMKDAFNR
jgi:DnaJ-class molecular chaperone